MPAFVAQTLKAFYAAAIAGLGALGAVIVGAAGISDVHTGQWIAIASATLVAFGGVWGVTNAPPPK